MRIYEDVDMNAPEMVSAKEKLDALVEELKSAGTSKVSFAFLPTQAWLVFFCYYDVSVVPRCRSCNHATFLWVAFQLTFVIHKTKIKMFFRPTSL